MAMFAERILPKKICDIFPELLRLKVEYFRLQHPSLTGVIR